MVKKKIFLQGDTLKCLSIGTSKIINFPFVSNGKLIVFKCPNIQACCNEAVLCEDHNLGFYAKKWKIIPKVSLIVLCPSCIPDYKYLSIISISIFHVCMVWIEKYVTRVTDRHHEAC